MRIKRLLPTLLMTLTAAAALPDATVGATLVNRASMAVQASYTLRANLSYTDATVSAVEQISIRNVSGMTISKLYLSVLPRAFGELVSIGGFRVDDRAVSARWTNNANLELQLGRNLAHRESATVRLSFKVRASSVVDTSLEGRLSRVNGIMQVSHWFPIISNGHPMRYPGDSQHTRTASKIRLSVTTDSTSVKIAAPGTLVSAADRTHVYEIENARDFAFGASPYYRVATGTAGDTDIAAYYTSGDGAAAVASAKAALLTYEPTFGTYQWPRLVIAQTGRLGSGNEYPGIVFLGKTLFSSRVIVAHEIAHQWWYGMAGNDQMREAWLDEGIAEFAASYFFGSFHSYVSTRPVNASIYEYPNVPAPLNATEPGSYNQTVYFKSAQFLQGLRTRMGSAAFFAGLRALFEANRNGIVTTREFFDTMAAHGASKTYMASFIRL
jgi:hypothetical protein